METYTSFLIVEVQNQRMLLAYISDRHSANCGPRPNCELFSIFIGPRTTYFMIRFVCKSNSPARVAWAKTSIVL